MGYYYVANSRVTWGALDPGVKQNYRSQLVERDGSVCSRKNHHGCGRHMELASLTVDHVIPISQGGPVMDLSNMQLLCGGCHRRKTKNDIFNSGGAKSKAHRKKNRYSTRGFFR